MNPNLYATAGALALLIIGVGTWAHTEVSGVSYAEGYSACANISMPEITAKAAYIYDLRKDAPLFEKNSESQLPLASLTKIVTALVATEELEPTDEVTITNESMTPEGDSGSIAGETWRVDDLRAFTLMTSSNDGARALALASSAQSLEAFISAMNILAEKAGARQTFFLNDTGLDVSPTLAGAYGSARDIALILRYAYQSGKDPFEGASQAASVYTSLSGVTHTAEHTSSVAGSITGELVVKTGFTDLAGGNLAVLAEVLPGRPVAIVVLGATRETRDSDASVLIGAAKEALKRATLCETL